MNKIKFLKQVSEMIHEWLPLNFIRDYKELKKTMVYEFFDKNFKDSSEYLQMEKLFWDKNYFSEIECEKTQDEIISLMLHLSEYKPLEFINLEYDSYFKQKNIELLKSIEESEIKETVQEIFDEAKKEISFDEELSQTMHFIQNTSQLVEDGEIDTMRGYIALKKVEKTLKKYLSLTGELARQVFENYDKNDLPYGAKGSIMTKTTINYKSNNFYAEQQEKLKEFEAKLKNVVEQHKKNNTVCDENGETIEVPEFKMSESLVIKGV